MTGYGTVHGRLVMCLHKIYGSEGSLAEAHAEKITKVMDLAMKREPINWVTDSGGARIQEGVVSLVGTLISSTATYKPQGSFPSFQRCMDRAGGAVYSPALTDFIMMVEDTSYMFVTGPNVVKQ